MAQIKTTHDSFTAIAEPKRRALVEHLAGKSLSVNELVMLTGWSQPMVSKHLSVLKQVGLVTEMKEGRSRIYSLSPSQLQPIQLWVKQFEKYWNTQFNQLDSYLEELQSSDSTNAGENE